MGRSVPVSLAEFRCGCTLVAAWTFYRFWIVGMGWPWKWAIVADTRDSVESKVVVLTEAFPWASDWLDKHFSARFVGILIEVFQMANRSVPSKCQIVLRSSWAARFLMTWSWLNRMGVAGVEFIHGRNRARAQDGNISWPTFVAHCVLSESRIRHAFNHGLLQPAQGPPPPTPAVAKVAGNAAPRRVRNISAKGIFINVMRQEKQAL